MHEDNPILAFARDFSNNDEAIVSEVQGYIDQPPTDGKVIDFHGLRNADATTRTFLATVQRLRARGWLSSVEDKYTFEIVKAWQSKGWIAPLLPPAVKAVFGPFLDPDLVDPKFSFDGYSRDLWAHYADATKEIEQSFWSHGKVLLSIDATDGDTLFFAAVAPDVAARWCDKALCAWQGYYAGVRRPMWDCFYAHLVYALQLAPMQEGYPLGISLREDVLPFA